MLDSLRRPPPPCAETFIARCAPHPRSSSGCFCTPARCPLCGSEPAGAQRLGTCGWVVPGIARRAG